MKLIIATFVIAIAGVVALGQAPTLQTVTADPNLPSELYYGNVKVKPLRVRPGTNPPQFSPGVIIPTCYNSTNGNLRLVKPWGVTGVPGGEPNCRPPSPWDSINVPAGGFDAHPVGGDRRLHDLLVWPSATMGMGIVPSATSTASPDAKNTVLPKSATPRLVGCRKITSSGRGRR